MPSAENRNINMAAGLYILPAQAEEDSPSVRHSTSDSISSYP